MRVIHYKSGINYYDESFTGIVHYGLTTYNVFINGECDRTWMSPNFWIHPLVIRCALFRDGGLLP